MTNAQIAVVGAGPAGLAAAATAADLGLRVTLVDENGLPGGQFLRQPLPGVRKAGERRNEVRPPTESVSSSIEVHKTGERRDGTGSRLLRRMRRGDVELRLGTAVWGVDDERTLWLLGPEGMDRLEARALVVATGAYDRPVAFPGWTLPGVMTAGAAQTLVKSSGVLPGRRVLLAGSGPFLLPVAQELLRAGATIVALAEATGPGAWLGRAPRGWGHWDRLWEGWRYVRSLLAGRVPVLPGHVVARAEGDERVRSATLTAVDGEWRPRPGTERRFEVDALAVGYGFTAGTELVRLLGCELRWGERQRQHLPSHDLDQRTSVPGVLVAGEAGGIGGAEVAFASGRLAALAAARELGVLAPGGFERLAAPVRRQLARHRRFAAIVNATFAPRAGLWELMSDDTVVCRCEEVTAGEVRAAIVPGLPDANALKAATRVGMGLCQGRYCGPLVTELVAAATGAPVSGVRPFGVRPPLRPVPFVMAG
ncbi:MAG: FAD-dependent oxidoreductase [Chloroflexi bacterium]|nr:FAD-dependent oxidoreductase [Chloroflexota bacterium]